MLGHLKYHVTKRLTAPFRNAFDTQVDHCLRQDAKNIERSLQRKALEETTAFVEQHLRQVKSCPDRMALLSHALRLAPAHGLILEFGVYKGASLNALASRVPGPVYGFDSFEGLPEAWFGKFEQGYWRVGRLPRVRKNAALITGWFKDTLPAFLAQHPGPCALVHVDCDLYSSTDTVLRGLADRLVSGTVLVFDEFFNYPGWTQDGEYRAFMEFTAARGCAFEYLGYCHRSEQVAVRLL